jgi:polyisoprenoid-binding protein YceI
MYAMLQTFRFLFATVALLSSPAFASDKVSLKLDPTSGSVIFRATGRPSAIKIVGKGSQAKGEFTIVDGKKVTGSAAFDLNSLDTGITMRTNHMKERYLETKEHPEAKLTITEMELPKPLFPEADGKITPTSEEAPFKGKLALHGQEHDVTGTAKLESKADKQVSLNAQFGLKIADYGIKEPSFAGVKMADDVQIEVQGVAKP